VNITNRLAAIIGEKRKRKFVRIEEFQLSVKWSEKNEEVKGKKEGMFSLPAAGRILENVFT